MRERWQNGGPTRIWNLEPTDYESFHGLRKQRKSPSSLGRIRQTPAKSATPDATRKTENCEKTAANSAGEKASSLWCSESCAQTLPKVFLCFVETARYGVPCRERLARCAFRGIERGRSQSTKFGNAIRRNRGGGELTGEHVG